MSELLLNYGDIKDAIKAADKAADYIFDYTKELQKKIINEMNDLKKGASGYTDNVVFYTKQEIGGLDKTSARLTSYHDKLDDFLNGESGAKKTDKKVADNIKTKSEVFRRDHGMEVNCVEEFFAWLSAEILDKSAFCQWLKKAFTTVSGWLDDFKQWFELEGGKYIIGAIGAAVLAVCAAVALVVFAWPALLAAGTVWAWVVAAAGVVTTILLVADSITNCVFDVMAYAKNKTDAAWASRYDSFNSLDTFLNKFRFESAAWNRFSYGAAIAIKVTNTVCTIINLADMAVNATKLVKLYRKNPRSIFGITEIHFRDGSGKFTFSSLKYGCQTVYNNYKTIIDQISTGDFMRYQKTLFKNGELGRWMKIHSNVKSTAKMAKDISEKGFSKYSSNKFKKKFFLHSRYEDIKGITENFTGIRDIAEQLGGFVSDGTGSSVSASSGSIIRGGIEINIPKVPTITPIKICPRPNFSSVIYPRGTVPVIVPEIVSNIHVMSGINGFPPAASRSPIIGNIQWKTSIQTVVNSPLHAYGY